MQINGAYLTTLKIKIKIVRITTTCESHYEKQRVPQGFRLERLDVLERTRVFNRVRYLFIIAEQSCLVRFRQYSGLPRVCFDLSRWAPGKHWHPDSEFACGHLQPTFDCIRRVSPLGPIELFDLFSQECLGNKFDRSSTPYSTPFRPQYLALLCAMIPTMQTSVAS